MNTEISVLAALGAGLLSFLSPCVLPVIPGYLSFVSGQGAAELKSGQARSLVFFRTLFFTLGFSAVFVALGIVFSGSGMLFAGNAARVVTIVAGALIALFGLNMIFDFIKVLNREARAHVSSRPVGAAGAFVVGMAFGAGWTPCIGPVLMSILFMASRAGGTGKAILLLSAYSLGLALPFLAAGLFFDRMTPLLNWFKKRGKEVRIVSGILLVLIGLVMALGKLTSLNGFFGRMAFGIKSALSSSHSAVKAWTVGALALAALAAILPPLIRKKPFARVGRIVFLCIVGLLIGLELTGVLSLAGLLSDWFLFQGA